MVLVCLHSILGGQHLPSNALMTYSFLRIKKILDCFPLKEVLRDVVIYKTWASEHSCR